MRQDIEMGGLACVPILLRADFEETLQSHGGVGRGWGTGTWVLAGDNKGSPGVPSAPRLPGVCRLDHDRCLCKHRIYRLSSNLTKNCNSDCRVNPGGGGGLWGGGSLKAALPWPAGQGVHRNTGSHRGTGSSAADL